MTKEEMIAQYPYVGAFLSSGQGYEVMLTLMKEYAQQEVENALKAASEKALLNLETGWGTLEHRGSKDFHKEKNIRKTQYGHGDSTYEIITVDKESILTAYKVE